MPKYKLQKKNELHYRKGSTIEIRNCRWCKYFRAECISYRNQLEPRCEIMGLEAPGEYTGRPDYTCDARR